MLWGYVITACAALLGSLGTIQLTQRSARRQREADRADAERIAQRRAVAEVLAIGQRYSYYLESGLELGQQGGISASRYEQVAHDVGEAMRDFEVAVAVAELSITHPEVARCLRELTARGFLNPHDEESATSSVGVISQFQARLNANLAQLKLVASKAYTTNVARPPAA